MKATFVRKTKANKSDATNFCFLPEHQMKFTAGQFTELTLKNVGKHWFTISSRPGLKEVTITTRLTGSNFKNALDNLKTGDHVDLAEAMGDFVLPIDERIPILMVAGGIGITPFLSILSDYLNVGVKRNLNLLYAARTGNDFVNLSKYRYLLTTFKQLEGRLDSKLILNMASALKSPYIYISGPEPMVESLVKDIKATGFPESQLVADYFPGYS